MQLTKNSYFIFSGGEVHCKISENSDSYDNVVQVDCFDYTMNGLMALFEIDEILKRQEYQVSVLYPYLPYARQDRVMLNFEPFSLKIFCDLLNSRNFKSVCMWDPHSDVAQALINNCMTVPQFYIARMAIPRQYFDDPNVLFISPDAGAYKKISKLITDDSRIAIGVKNRDSAGKITSTNVFSPVDISGKECFIVDDICDGGRTFIELAKVLRAKGAVKIYLYVTHGIFSQGFGELETYIDHIYTTNSFPENGPKKLVSVYTVAGR